MLDRRGWVTRVTSSASAAPRARFTGFGSLVLKGKIATHLIVSKSAALTLRKELDLSVEQVRALAHTNHANADVGAAISSGSFKTIGMVIVPCSIRTLSDIAYGTIDTR
jgi:polyprenyl P-hydroxybenzoate/phenylacrylic acid decarboxylase-like protein